ncbi:hypothetical protein EQG41_19635 [Billgrantia azerbaijanica]|nr:hypothetical protein EQG41_19635 [Halomonas azerbaijanica]
MMTRLQERAVRRVIKRGGELELPGHKGPVRLIVTRHGEIVSVTVTAPGLVEHRPYTGPAREVYPLAAQLLDTVVTAPCREVAHG